VKFPYVQVRGFYMPIIPVVLRRGDATIASMALVDSGAAKCIFDAQYAEALGIADVEAGNPVKFEGVTGATFVGYQHEVSLIVGGNSFANVLITFAEGMPDNAAGILGQDGFFDLFPIKFTYSKHQIELMARTAAP